MCCQLLRLCRGKYRCIVLQLRTGVALSFQLILASRAECGSGDQSVT
jgi:hypothetical protein